MTPTLADLQALNTQENKQPYVAGMGPTEPVDWWTYRPVAGNSWVCRDFVEAKAEALRERGVDPLTLTVLLLWTEPVMPPPNVREYHAVLCVDVGSFELPGGGTWVLDSRFDQIYPFNNPPVDYRYDRRQIPGTTDFASVIDGPSALA